VHALLAKSPVHAHRALHAHSTLQELFACLGFVIRFRVVVRIRVGLGLGFGFG